MKQTGCFIVAAAVTVLLTFLCGCTGQKKAQMTDAQLGLNPQQARGRAIYRADCASCHHAYSSSGSQGPSLKGLFKRKYLPSGLPANDRFVEQTIVGGRGMMPPVGGQLTGQQIADLLAYLHTL